eukprot:GHVU01162677.1.p1 GENE.GHVU01162677.1~~GHVU01162677.1.p1  ORF type:complete len:217 (+),score=21.00 GHVU01162677.1:55-705(+)
MSPPKRQTAQSGRTVSPEAQSVRREGAPAVMAAGDAQQKLLRKRAREAMTNKKSRMEQGTSQPLQASGSPVLPTLHSDMVAGSATAGVAAGRGSVLRSKTRAAAVEAPRNQQPTQRRVITAATTAAADDGGSRLGLQHADGQRSFLVTAGGEAGGASPSRGGRGGAVRARSSVSAIMRGRGRGLSSPPTALTLSPRPDSALQAPLLLLRGLRRPSR